MTTFVNAVKNQEARTTNGMKARKSTASACVDLFFKIGASRGQKIVPLFTGAYVENRDLALRIAQWARDVRGGAGERELFRQIFADLAKNDTDACRALVRKVPEIGRWDDLLVLAGTELEAEAFELIKQALNEGNGLCAKWMPRKGDVAAKLRSYLGFTPKQYRKTLVSLTNVVEQKMCAKQWTDINFSHVPSLAHSRYKTAFFRNAKDVYADYVSSLVKGEDPKVKVNAGAVFPYDVLKGRIGVYSRGWSKTELDLIQKQWEALPNYVGDANVLPMVDVSGSMTSRIGGANTLTALDVAVSLGLYLADKNKGKFADTFLTFSGSPELLHLRGNINQKIDQMVQSKWGMNTNVIAAFTKILKVAKDNNVPQEEMPQTLLILSDMQFDQCARFDHSAFESVQHQYEKAGYAIPRIVFWNINSHDNVPVKYDQRGAALVSGFSPSIVQSVLSGDEENFTPEGIMLKTIMVDRYAL